VSARLAPQSGLTPLAILGFAWSTLAPMLTATQLVTLLGGLRQESVRVTMLGTWIAGHLEALRFGLWAVGLLSIGIAILCVVRKASAYASTSAALALSLLSGSTLFLALFLSSFARAVEVP
jgi:hypothetical protein